jgi:hypothetical protein
MQVASSIKVLFIWRKTFRLVASFPGGARSCFGIDSWPQSASVSHKAFGNADRIAASAIRQNDGVAASLDGRQIVEQCIFALK